MPGAVGSAGAEAEGWGEDPVRGACPSVEKGAMGDAADRELVSERCERFECF